MPYELDVDIIKDCTNFKNEIREVLDVIDKDGEAYPVMMEKVSLIEWTFCLTFMTISMVTFKGIIIIYDLHVLPSILNFQTIYKIV